VEGLRFPLSKLTARRNMQTEQFSDMENEKAVFRLKGLHYSCTSLVGFVRLRLALKFKSSSVMTKQK
jgi:hypothetical protein